MDFFTKRAPNAMSGQSSNPAGRRTFVGGIAPHPTATTWLSSSSSAGM